MKVVFLIQIYFFIFFFKSNEFFTSLAQKFLLQSRPTILAEINFFPIVTIPDHCVIIKSYLSKKKYIIVICIFTRNQMVLFVFVQQSCIYRVWRHNCIVLRNMTSRHVLHSFF